MPRFFSSGREEILQERWGKAWGGGRKEGFAFYAECSSLNLLPTPHPFFFSFFFFFFSAF
jgi:hypothetical protein